VANQEEKKLNKEQLEAVEYGEGPLLIIAGAGTGKTTVITERIKYLVSSDKAKPSEILALTFTDKAAREMEERVDVAMPYGYTDMWISTFHSFCDRVLRQEAIHIGLDPGYKLMTEAETTQFLIKNLFKFDLKYFRPLGNPTKFVSGMLQHFSRLKDEDVSPEEYIRFAQSQKSKVKSQKLEADEIEKTLELAEAYQTYEKLKVKEGVMDFGDLISNTLKLFRTRKNILGQYQEQFKYILVDEFQDTNYAQYALLKVLAPLNKIPNLTVVGDDSQSIYKFRGAAVSNILQFMEEYKNARQVILTKNYRSTQTILNHAYKLIKHNDPDTLEVKLGISKDLEGIRKVEEIPIEFLHTDRVENEAEQVANKIKNLKLKIKNLEYKDIAILVRANNHADPFVRALSRAGIPYQFLGPGQLFRQPEVKDLIAYLKVLYNFEDNVALYRVLTMDHFDISARDLVAINNYGRKMNLSLFEACEVVSKIFVSQKTKDKISDFVEMVHRHLKLLPTQTAGQILYYFLEDSGFLKKLTEYKSPIEEKQAQNISRFFDRLRTYEVDHEDASVQAVVDWINLSMTLGESPLATNIDWTEENRVNILTAHSAKGLEFPVVFLVNLVSGRFPTRERREQIPIPEELIKEILPVGDYHEQEERRLFYVGMTRARDRLYLTAANYYGEGKRERKISSFVIEALGELGIKKLESKRLREEEIQQLSILDWQKPKAPELPITNYQLSITYLSFSQIETFNTCPLQYRYRYTQRIPVPPSATQSFGDSVHKTLRDFYQKLKGGEELTKDDLLKILDFKWLSQGYASKAHEQKMKIQAQRMLSGFYDKFDAKIIPKDLEQSFIIKVNPELKIGGKIDRVDEVGGKLEIIDYKTGKVFDQKIVDNSLQMTVYALAATDKGIYGKKPEEIILTFYFLDTLEKRSTKRTDEQLKQAKKQLWQKAKEIEKSSFEPTPSNMCDFCEYKLLCEAWI
jgi:DNA helicase-2/ATP-dependent DNA helicase PcrA